jgi:hypothetical protein
MKSIFEAKFGANPEPIKDRALYFDIKLIEAPYTRLGLSYVQFFVKNNTIKLEYKKSDMPQTHFYIKGKEEGIALKSAINYQIILSKVPKLESESFLAYLSHCIQLNFSPEFNTKMITYFNAFENSYHSKELNLTSLNITLEVKKEENQGEFHQIFLTELEEKLAKYNLSLSTIRFNDLFNLSFTKDESKWLTELIVYKTKCEEIYESLEHKIDFAVELMNQIEEKTSIFYKNYTKKAVKNRIDISENVAIFINK